MSFLFLFPLPMHVYKYEKESNFLEESKIDESSWEKGKSVGNDISLPHYHTQNSAKTIWPAFFHIN